MNLSVRQIKWLKVSGVFFSVLLLIVVVLYYTITVRLKDTIRIIVDKESDGLYTFDAAKVDVSLASKSILFKNASFTCRDTTNTTPHYDVKIADVFFSLQSLKDLVFSRKISIDSVSVSIPQLSIHEHSNQKAKHVAFHASTIFDILQKLKSQLEIRSFSIHKASFYYGNIHNSLPFKSNQISLTVKNFSKDNDPQKSFLSSDDIDLSILNQHWKLPDGLHEIRFSNLHFSGKSQFFEVDSCSFIGINKDGNTFSVGAQKLFFNSRQLTDFYNKEELILDTLLLYEPDIYIETVQKNTHTDSRESISSSLKKLLNVINFKYIDIIEGRVQVVQKNTQQNIFATEGTNLKIYNLLLNKDSANINIDLISLKQKNLNFVTKDSLFELNIEEFAIEKNSVYLRNASYKPTIKNHGIKIFTFNSPLLKLIKVNFEDLLEKKLNAVEAELYEPQISFEVEKEKKKIINSTQKQERFYGTLNGLSELLLVENFRIINGNLRYESTGISPMQVQMQHVNALVLPNRLFSSDSLIDVKRSLPAVAIGNVRLISPKVNLNVSGFTFQGDVRHNYATKFELNLANGTSVKGKGLSWIIFDWDRYHNYKQIDVNTMRIKEVSIIAKAKEKNEHVAKDLPVIHLDRIDIEKINFNSSGANEIKMNGQQVCIDNINSLRHGFTWTNAEGLFNHIEIKQPSLNVKVASVALNTQSHTNIHKADIQITKPDSKVHINVPYISTDIQLHSSNFSSIDIPMLTIQNPSVRIQKNAERKLNTISEVNTTPSAQLSIGKLNIQDGRLQYSSIGSTDSLDIKTGINIQGENIVRDSNNANILSWNKVAMQVNALAFKKNIANVSLADMETILNSGKLYIKKGKVDFTTLISIKWRDGQLNVINKDSTGLSANKLSGQLKNHSFSFRKSEKVDWKKLVPLLSIKASDIYYKTQTSLIAVNGVEYNGPERKVNLSSFSFLPDADAATFFEQKGWQASYTFLETGNINISDVHLKEDSVFKASKVIITAPTLTTKKDKRYPFKHGIERPMLARMINNLKFPIDVDSVLINKGTVYVHEVTEKTHREAIIPLEQINAVATHVRNRNNNNDSLIITASLQLYNTKAHHFSYKEAYGDTLSPFALQVRLSPVILPEFSAITMPYANVNVIDGRADTLFADWVGNKYAAVGKMNFFYDNLKVEFMSKKDSSRSTFFKRMLSFLANDIALHKKNNDSAIIFFVRDPEKSVFNFWVKTKLNGVLASAAILQRKKHLKEYKKNREKYYLPDIEY